MEPILKWAGGKRQLLSEIKKIILPESLDGHTFFEPFVGGGSVFMAYEHESVVINDFNAELINVYQEIMSHPREVIDLLKEHKDKHNHDYYYFVRHMDREKNYSTMSNIEKAARIIYLNRTCYNGLYRVNAKGHYNVPIGRYVNPDIVQEEKILLLHKYLFNNAVEIMCGDFETAVSGAKNGDVVYFDPPYDYDESGFTSYTMESFAREDLVRLKRVCDQLIDSGCKVVVSNNNTTYVNELFNEQKYTKKIVMAKRMINCKGQKRNEVKEVLIYG